MAVTRTPSYIDAQDRGEFVQSLFEGQYESVDDAVEALKWYEEIRGEPTEDIRDGLLTLAVYNFDQIQDPEVIDKNGPGYKWKFSYEGRDVEINFQGSNKLEGRVIDQNSNTRFFQVDSDQSPVDSLEKLLEGKGRKNKQELFSKNPQGYFNRSNQVKEGIETDKGTDSIVQDGEESSSASNTSLSNAKDIRSIECILREVKSYIEEEDYLGIEDNEESEGIMGWRKFSRYLPLIDLSHEEVGGEIVFDGEIPEINDFEALVYHLVNNHESNLNYIWDEEMEEDAEKIALEDLFEENDVRKEAIVECEETNDRNPELRVFDDGEGIVYEFEIHLAKDVLRPEGEEPHNWLDEIPSAELEIRDPDYSMEGIREFLQCEQDRYEWIGGTSQVMDSENMEVDAGSKKASDKERELELA